MMIPFFSWRYTTKYSLNLFTVHRVGWTMDQWKSSFRQGKEYFVSLSEPTIQLRGKSLNQKTSVPRWFQNTTLVFDFQVNDKDIIYYNACFIWLEPLSLTELVCMFTGIYYSCSKEWGLQLKSSGLYKHNYSSMLLGATSKVTGYDPSAKGPRGLCHILSRRGGSHFFWTAPGHKSETSLAPL